MDRLLDDDRWYSLRAAPERLAVRRFEDPRAPEELAGELIAEYADRFWRKRRRAWENAHIDVIDAGRERPQQRPGIPALRGRGEDAAGRGRP